MIQKSKFRAEGGLVRASKKGWCSISEGEVVQFPSEGKRNEAETMWIDERSVMLCRRHGDVLFWWLLFTSRNKKQEYQLKWEWGRKEKVWNGYEENRRLKGFGKTIQLPQQLNRLMSASWFIKSRKSSHHEFSPAVFNWTSAGNKWERGECNQH